MFAVPPHVWGALRTAAATMIGVPNGNKALRECDRPDIHGANAAGRFMTVSPCCMDSAQRRDRARDLALMDFRAWCPERYPICP